MAQMSELLFGDADPAHCYAAHRLLSEDRTLFKQVCCQGCQQRASGCDRTDSSKVDTSRLQVSKLSNELAA